MNTAKKDTKFKPGNKGKPKGAVTKVNKLVKDVVADVFNHLQTDPTAKKKRADMKNWAKDNPKDFYLIAAKLIPVQMQHSGEMIVNWHEEKTYETKPKTDTGS